MSVFNFNSGKNMSAYPQIQNDLTATNLNLHCDPRTVGPTGTFLDMKSKAGKIAVEDDICDLNVANLTVNGKLKANIGAEVCDIVCPEDFSVRAARNSLVNSGNGQIVYSNLSGQTDLSNNIIQNVTGLVPSPALLVTSVANPATLYGAIQWRLSISGGIVDGIFVNELVNLSAGTVITITQATLFAAGNPGASGDLIFSITAADVTLSPPEGCIAMLASNNSSILTVPAPPPLQNNSSIHVYADSYVDIETREHVNMSMGNYFIVNAGNTQPSTTGGFTEGIGQRLVVDEQLFRIEPQEINIGKPTITGGNMTVMNGSCNSVGRLKGVSSQQTNFIQGIGTEKGGANTIQFTTGMPFGAPIVVLSYQGGILTGTAKPQITLVKTTNTNFEIDVTTSPDPAGVFLIPGVSLGNFNPNPIPGAATGVYNCTTTSLGVGTGAILKVTISAGGNVDSVEVLSSGGGYALLDTVTVPLAQITGATADLVVTLSSNSELGTGLLEDMYINYQIIGLSELQ